MITTPLAPASPYARFAVAPFSTSIVLDRRRVEIADRGRHARAVATRQHAAVEHIKHVARKAQRDALVRCWNYRRMRKSLSAASSNENDYECERSRDILARSI